MAILLFLEDQYQSLIAREEQSTINQQRKAPVDKNIPNPKVIQILRQLVIEEMNLSNNSFCLLD